MRKKPSKKMIKARSLRKKDMTLQQIADELKVTRPGARWLIMRSDDFLGPPMLGSLRDLKEYISERNKGLRTPRENAPSS